jgi:nitrogen regulatory protein P-II 2
MTKHPKKLLTIITEAAIEKLLTADAKRLGAQGYTVLDVRGGSAHATHEGQWEADRMVEMKIICDEAVADAIAAHVMQRYAPHYGVSMFFSDVAVIRPEKF